MKHLVLTKRRRLFFVLLVGIGLLGIPLSSPLWHRWQQNQQDALLVQALQKNDTQSALRALEAGANAKLKMLPPPQISFWQWIRQALRRGKLPPPSSPQSATELPLPLAVEMNNTRVAIELLRRGADPNNSAIPTTGMDAVLLWEATYHNNKELVVALLQAGADVKGRGNPLGDTALSAACVGGFTELAEILLQHGADFEDANHFGGRPLLHAIHHETPQIVALLLRWKANVNTPDNQGVTPLQWAKRIENPQARRAIVQMLKKAGAK